MREPNQNLLLRFTAVWQRWLAAAGETTAAGQRLLDAYNAPDRAYHNLVHLADVLAKLDWARNALMAAGDLAPGDHQRLFDRIELALFYHDIVYDPTAKDNEARSREAFISDARHFGLPQDDIDAVARLIDITANHTAALALDEKIMSDCDLAILGAPREEFNAYDRNIRREYKDVPAPLFCARRAAVMKKFYTAPRLFKTAAFHTRYDAAARANLKTLITPSVLQKALLLFQR